MRRLRVGESGVDVVSTRCGGVGPGQQSGLRQQLQRLGSVPLDDVSAAAGDVEVEGERGKVAVVVE